MMKAILILLEHICDISIYSFNVLLAILTIDLIGILIVSFNVVGLVGSYTLLNIRSGSNLSNLPTVVLDNLSNVSSLRMFILFTSLPNSPILEICG